MSSILVICTGNAARSVMVGAIVNDRRPDLNVVTAGTLTMDGQPISWRTREALKRIELNAPNHRSKQMQQHHGDEAELIVALAPEHVEWVRRNHPHVAHKTVTLKRLVKHLSHDRRTSLAERVAALRAHEVELEPWEEVVDPGGGEVEVFIDCAIEVVALCDELCPRL